MTTRSGRSFKKTTMAAEATERLQEMMKVLLEDRRTRESEIAAERERREQDIARRERELEDGRQKREQEFSLQREAREREVARQMDSMREQMEALIQVVKESQAAAKPHSAPNIKLVQLTENDDIEAYLVTFERIMGAHKIEEDRWAHYLTPQLTGKAQLAFAALPSGDSGNYKAIKTAILARYDVNKETYRRRFRTATRAKEETNRELAVRLMDLQSKWLRDCTTVGEMAEAIGLEQFLGTLPRDKRVWVSEKKPKTCVEAGELADQYDQVRRMEPVHEEQKKRTTGQRRCFSCGQAGHMARECPNTKAKDASGNIPGQDTKAQEGMTAQTSKRERPEVKCYNCGQKGHISRRCPSNAMLCMGAVPRTHGGGVQAGGVTRSGVVEGRRVVDVILDTGCSKTLVRSDLVRAEKFIEGDVVTIRCAHGDTVLYPIAVVEMEVEGLPLCVEAAVSDTLPVSVLLGTDVPELASLLGDQVIEGARGAEASALVVRTRAQTRRQEEDEAILRERDATSGAQPRPVQPEKTRGATPMEEDVEQLLIGSEFADDLFSPGHSKSGQTRREKRELRRQFAEELGGRDKVPAVPTSPLDIPAAKLRELQRADPTLEAANRAADGECSTAGAGFFRKDGLLYRKWTPPGRDQDGMHVEQLVLPATCRPKVLELAHTIPMAGHLGRDKTARRLLQRFYWPTLFKDVAVYCRGCAECQKSGGARVQRAPLIPLPIVGEPFQRVAMDLVGPLPRSRAGNRYILVVCDYATRYPEAIPLRSIDAEHVADELITLFSCVGIPKEILTDQGSNFTSRLLAEIYKLLHVHPIRTTPYHPQTDGLVERFNKTLKALLRKTASDGKDWDKLLPYVLFAYREVPQASTGFSPFELLYGRAVRGPLDILKEEWESDRHSSESVVSHVLSIRDKLCKMTELVAENLTDAQRKQKRWYDRTARDRVFKEGDQVLVLLPTSTSKLLASWRGPYQVIRRVGKVSYLVDMHDTRKRKRILHVNKLRQWHMPATVGYAVEDGPEVDEVGGFVPDFAPEADSGSPALGQQLNSQQRQDLQGLFERFQDVLHSQPGRTSLAVHHIRTGTARPVKLPPYRLPHAYRDAVQAELQMMLDTGVIEPSRSEWASPIVVVRKKDGGIRLCVDYRRLNSVTSGDAYPMPRIDEVIDKLGGAKYLTTLDLSRGYWQVPVAEQDQVKTAFATHSGLYQFRVMPFGLCGAPATFQRMMDTLLHGMESFAAAYLDDLVIFSETWQQHCEHIREVLTCLRQNGLTAKPAKCQFGMRQCVYLGHVVGNGHVQPEVDKLHAVRDFPTSTSKQQVRSFLGLTGYYRRFIPDYAALAVPLTDLTRKTAPNLVQWTTQCESAFTELKHRLCSAPLLWSPNWSLAFVVQTDASDRGVGAVLSQVDREGHDHPIAYFSRKLLPREVRYSTVEKECLAIRLGLQAFRVYLLGRPFTVQTDHRALQWLDRLKESSARLMRWSLALQEFDFRVEHRAGSKNANADSLSRVL